MPIIEKRKNEEMFPRMGNHEDLFERLAEYIDVFDKTWKEKIKPASKEQIEKLRNVSQLKKYAKDFPKPYLVFLETMGVDDGGLLSRYLNGKSNIEDIIDVYREYELYEPEIMETPYLAIFDEDMDRQLHVDLSKKDLDNTFAIEKDGDIMFESFEKALFQAACRHFENIKYRVDFSTSKNRMEEAKEKYQIEEVFEEVEKIGEKYQLKKAWFSDSRYDIMLGEKLSIGVRKSQIGGGGGFVTGEEAEIVEQVANEVMELMGGRIYKSNLP